ncbi:MAG: hypothetical protein HY073_01400 [Deltaproteobacteria bacterium]|nr:hypothetical protein [Deltaproteobacteria bacterium]
MLASCDKIDAPSLPEFFRGKVKEVVQRQHLQIPDGAEFYLVNLLHQCSKTQDLYGPPPEGFREEPLAFLYCRAANESETSTRVQLFKRLGDFSLFFAGFFADSFRRQLIDVDYYVQMGEGAYGHLSQLLAKHAAFGEIFEELARRFMTYVDILSEVSEKSLKTNRDLLRLYEIWLKTGSNRAGHLLTEEGILPIGGTSLKSQ